MELNKLFSMAHKSNKATGLSLKSPGAPESDPWFGMEIYIPEEYNLRLFQ